jgi:uncharacterized surface protein with fasciclin (FAS1) repeats
MRFYASSLLAAIVGSGYYAVAQKQLEDIPTTAVNAGVFKTLVSALDAADLVDTLSGDDSGPYTVFAPNDIAFAKLSKSHLQCLLEPENKDLLTELLLYHVVDGKVLSSELTDGQVVPTLNDGQTVEVSIEQDQLDDLFGEWLDWLFPWLSSSDTTLTTVKINDSTVTLPDISATNGVIHVIDSVLIPQGFTACLQDIPTTATEAQAFDTLVAALDAADLVETLSGDGPFTVFAPTDHAFGMLDDDYIQCLLEPENKDALRELLLYHVADGKVLSTDLSNGQTVTTINGQDVEVKIDEYDALLGGSHVFVNDALVVLSDISASNGVIHAIRNVLIPEGFTTCQKDIPTVASEAGVFNTLVAALEAADLVDALSGDNGPYTVFAPTDKAFNKLPSDLVECLLEPENKDLLTELLLYHVADGKVLSTDLSDGQTIPTLSDGGKTININFVQEGWLFWHYTTVMINDNAKVIVLDNEARNGVIHVIDSVLVPDDFAGCTSRNLVSTAIDFGHRRNKLRV